MNDSSKRARAQPREAVTDKQWGRLTLKVLYFMHHAVRAVTFSTRLTLQMLSEPPPLESSGRTESSWEMPSMPSETSPPRSTRSSRRTPSKPSEAEEPPRNRASSSAEGLGPQCHCKLPSRLFTARIEGPNWMRQFWRCPKERALQCEFFAWSKQLPEEAHHAQEARDNHFRKGKKEFGKNQEAEVKSPQEEDFEKIKKTFQKMCPHKNLTKTGSNFFLKMESCKDCGKVLSREMTTDAKEVEKKKEAQDTKAEKATSSKNYSSKSEAEIRKRYAAMRKKMEESSSEEEVVSRRGGSRR
jgi:hypothetical protein